MTPQNNIHNTTNVVIVREQRHNQDFQINGPTSLVSEKKDGLK